MQTLRDLQVHTLRQRKVGYHSMLLLLMFTEPSPSEGCSLESDWAIGEALGVLVLCDQEFESRIGSVVARLPGLAERTPEQEKRVSTPQPKFSTQASSGRMMHYDVPSMTWSLQHMNWSMH